MQPVHMPLVFGGWASAKKSPVDRTPQLALICVLMVFPCLVLVVTVSGYEKGPIKSPWDDDAL